MLRAPVRKSILRRITVLGGDRRLVGIPALILVAITMTVFVGYGVLYGLTFAIPIVLFMIILWIARRLNAADPWMIDVLLRHFKYRKYYGPKSDRNIEHPQVRDYV